jgi:2-keto-4-pentenoate hydratase/2-oxohepta-3-ene-1,7-dioic acid hydratase in catechol pathway
MPEGNSIRKYGITLLACCCLLSQQVIAEDEHTAPRIMRYVSALEDFSGQTCYGLVLTEHGGIPATVYNLGGVNRDLCQQATATNSPAQLKLAFSTADTLAKKAQFPGKFIETLSQERLASDIKPPVDITLAQLGNKQRFIVGVGLNYHEHREETGGESHADLSTDEVLVFPKALVPTGAYVPVQAGAKVGTYPPRPVLLLDYEVELAMVLLDDLDLNAPPASYADFINGVAFFTANDVSDREPIILDSVHGYTRGKSHPGYLPTGPWMIHGRHLQPRTATEGNQILDLTVTVEEAAQGGRPARTHRLQSSDTGRMILGPWQIIRLLVSRHQQGLRTCMRDADGIPRYTQTPAGIIPAGSLVLTGTPGGTAIQAPGLLGKLDLFVRGGFSPTGARQQMIEDSEGDIQGSRYLEPGDLVETAITSLGQQQWRISKQTSLSPYGIDAPGDCHSPLHTSGHSEQK